MRRGHKVKFTDKVRAGLKIHLDLAKVHRLKELTSPYIIFHLHFLNLNNIVTQIFAVAEATFDLTRLVFTLFFACQVYAHACWFTKSKPSISPNYNGENGVKQIKIIEENLSQSCILC